VLRGPQGTLYGDGSLGGTIRILTNDPDLSNMEGSAELVGRGTNGGDESYAVKGVFNMPFKEDVAGLRLVATYEDIGGWIDNSATGEKDYNTREITNYRGKFRWAPTERLDMVFSAWHTEQDTVGTASSLDDETYPFPGDVLDSEYDLYGATIRYSFDSFELVSATSMMDYTANTTNVLFGQFEFTDDTEQDILTEELRLASTGDGIFRWTAGLFYRSIERDTFAELAAFAFTQDLSFESTSYAVFGETTLSLLDKKLDLTVGLRNFEDDREVSEEIAPALLQIIQSVDPSYTGRVDETFDTFNPRFNVSYRPNEDWLVYGNVAKGFRTGQPQPALSLGLAILSGVDVPTGIDPETLWSYEIGTKARLADGRVTLEAAAYFNDWEDLQVPVVVAQGVRALVNGGTGETQGFEFAASWLPIDGLTLQATASFVDATFTEDVTGININDGDDIPGVPDRTLTANATYRWPFAANMNGFAFGSVQYNSERTDTVNAVPPSDDIVLLDMRLGVEGEKWAAYLFGENLTDEYGAIDAYALGETGPALRPRPLTFGLQLSVNF
jgi:outer membrane receptor protein involved in Fe transport